MSQDELALKDTIKNSEDLVGWLEKYAYDQNFPYESTDRGMITHRFLRIGLEHNKSIILLLSHQHYTSAYSLIRVMIEILLKGQWVLHKASDSNIAFFAENVRFEKKYQRDFRKIADELKSISDGHKALIDEKDAIWNPLNDYLHTGKLPEQTSLQEVNATLIYLNYLTILLVADMQPQGRPKDIFSKKILELKI